MGLTLTEENGTMLHVPAGCAHGYLNLVPNTGLMYPNSTAYASAAAPGVRYNDPAFAIAWPAKDGYLNNPGIAYCGRHGDREYLGTDQSFISGENAVQRIFDRAGR